MISLEAIQELADRIAAEFEPQKIILFGSHAEGRAGRDSDVDLLVLMRFKGKGYRKAAEILKRLQPSFPVDLIVRTPAQFKQRIRMGDFFLRDIEEYGKLLYEKDYARVGT